MAPFARYKILILWALSVDQLPLATVDSFSLSLSLSLALFFFLLRSLSSFLPLFCFSPELLSCLISVCIMLQLSQLTRCSSSRRSTLSSSLLPPPRAIVRGIDLEKTRIMRDNASKLYIHGSGSRMLAASTIRVAITNFIDTSVLASPPSPLHRLDLFFSFPLFSFCLLLLPDLSRFTFCFSSVGSMFRSSPRCLSPSVASTTSLQKSLIIGEASKCYTCKLYLQIFLDAITSARSPSARVHDPFSLVAHYISARPYYVTT